MALIINIETGTDICSVALSKNDELLSLHESRQGKQHAQNVALFIEEILKQHQIAPEELDAIAVGEGPGSYTGLRIGVSVAKGMCYALNKPLIAVNSLQAMSMIVTEEYHEGIFQVNDPQTTTLCPMIDARRMEVYAQIFTLDSHPLTETQAVILEKGCFDPYPQQGEFIIFGNGAEKSLEVIKTPNVVLHNVLPSARGIVPLSYRKYQAGEFVDAAYFEPFYLKDFVVTTSKKKIL